MSKEQGKGQVVGLKEMESGGERESGDIKYWPLLNNWQIKIAERYFFPIPIGKLEVE